MKINVRPFLFYIAVVFMIQFTAAAPARAESADDRNVVIILDASGSMAEMMGDSRTVKMDAAKRALKAALKEAPQDTKIGLLIFSSKDGDKDWFYPLGKRNDAALFKAIDAPEPGWKTPLGQYIKIGADRLLKERKKQHGYGTFVLLIVTDGEATDPEVMERYVPEVLARGITIDVIGVDMEQDHTLATRVHSYRRADDPEMLKKAIVKAFAEVPSSGSDAAGEDAFAQLAAIPDGLAGPMLKALSNTGDYPIGEKPPSAQADEKQSRGGNPRATDSIKKSFEGSKTLFWTALILLIVVVAALIKRGRE